MPIFSAELEESIKRIHQFASLSGDEYLTLDHLLLALLDDPPASEAINACGIDPNFIRGKVFKYLYNDVDADELSKFKEVSEKQVRPLAPTTGFEKVLNRATIHVQGAGRSDIVTGVDVLLAIFSERHSHARNLLENVGLTRYDLTRYLSHGITKQRVMDGSRELNPSITPRSKTLKRKLEKGELKKTALSQYCINLVERAKNGKIDPLVGRETEVKRCFQTLLRRNKNNPLLVGDPGVGKTTIVEGMALKIAQGDIPEVLEGFTIYSLNMGAVLAGTRYRGDFEERLSNILKELRRKQKTALFIDEVHTLVGAGATSNGSMDASNLLKPSLQNGTLKCIGSTTHKDFKQHFEKDRALSRRFQKIDVNEPTEEETYQILKGIKPRLERHHSVRYTNEALKSTVKLSARYINNRKFPDKAIDIIDEAGASNRLRSQSKIRKTISVRDIEDTFAAIARVPSKKLSRSDSVVLSDLEKNLKIVVFGQDPAISALTSAIKLSRAGLRDQEKPVGSYLFAGPTGVGKTEVARQLAENLGAKLLRFDMSEFMEKHAVSRLIGAPPGYIGFEQGGLLTDGVDENPHSVVLLDEIEKAHPDVSNILLQVMDYGKLTDHSGRTVDFRNAILIMTTNAGAVELEKSAVGFGRESREGEDKIAVDKLFPPEFRNRLDAIISFKSLSTDTIVKVVQKFITQLEGQLIERNIQIEISDQASEWLGKKGYDTKMGARPLARLIQEEVKKPLADEILFGKLQKGGKIEIELKKDKLEFKISPPQKKKSSITKVPLLTSG